MQRLQIHSLLILFGVTLSLSACFTEPDYSNTPQIEAETPFVYKDLPAGQGVGRGRRDSVVIRVSFKDGDGDLGNDIPLSREDSLRFASNGGWGNYRIRTFRLENGRFRELDLAVNRTLFFPNLTKGKARGAITGDLDFNSVFQYGNRFQLYPVKFQIQIRDRALNESNVVETDTITVPFPRQ